MNVKVNDTVLVITGKYKGKQGKVLAAYPKNNRVIVEGVNIVHKHEKARKANETSRIVTEEAPIDVSNVEVVCDKCGKATRVAHSLADGKKVRICKKCGATLDKAYVKKSKAKEVEETEAPKKRTRKRTKKTEGETPVEETQE
ncbi:MAG: 50S ribosomal protein L24 [Clostridia bacterium]|jgi:large subunit ribosomal protein L24|nr:50S ribosomal protein L24 [Clostridia bacterium]